MASHDPPASTRGLLGRKGNRLPSLKGPRDLTLGGIQKKTFTPNIPVRPRDKTKDSSTEGGDCGTSVDKDRRKDGKDKHRRADRGRGRGRGRGRNEREVIQSHSIFEQGPMEGVKKGSGSWGSGDAGERTGGGASRPSGSIKREKKDNAETKRILDDLMQDDFLADRPRDGDPKMCPIKLPLTKDEVKSELMPDIKPKIKIEPDAESISSESTDKTDVDMKPGGKSESPTPSLDGLFKPSSCAELFRGAAKSDRGEFIFLQFPDTLPGEPSSRDEDPKSRSKQAAANEPLCQVLNDSQSDIEFELTKRLGLCTMEDFSEGYIGKVQVHKSGKTKLVLGNVALDIDLGATPGFLQDLVSIRVQDGDTEGDISVLGHVNHKLVCVPDFEAMLET